MIKARSLTQIEAIREALFQEMERDDRVLVMGLGVDDPKAILGSTRGLAERFGPDRVLDTPLSEDGMTGACIGMAMAGLRPVHVHIRVDFLMLAMNQIVNVAAKTKYMSGGQQAVPLVVRAIIGRSWGQGAQHSQALHSIFMHVPGLKVVAPSTPLDAKGALTYAIRDDNPVIFIEHRLLHGFTSAVPSGEVIRGPGSCRVLRRGGDLTLVGISYMVPECLRAAEWLSTVGIECEVLDPVWLSPLDVEGINASVAKTGRLLVADNAWLECGASAEIVAAACEALGSTRRLAVGRVGFAATPCPTSPSLEAAFYAGATSIAREAFRLVKGELPERGSDLDVPAEVREFRGPF
jgi:pyruvate/2-oxoglutarate/acetoin dehydrogenase E1 component